MSLASATFTRHLPQILPAPTNQDTAIEYLKLTPSSTDVGPIEDAATEAFALTASATETRVITDVATESFKLVASAVEAYSHVYQDSGTELYRFTPFADEHYCPKKVEFEGELYARWEAERKNRWVATFQSRWQAQFLGVGEGFAC